MMRLIQGLGRSLLSLWLASLFLLGQGTFQSLVLCFGADGHMALELASAGNRCGEDVYDGSKGSVEARILTAFDVHCGPCTDLPISSELQDPSILPGLKRLLQEDRLGPEISLFALRINIQNPSQVFLPERSSADPAVLFSIQSVVLRI